MKHWIAVGIIAAMATGLSVVNGGGEPAARTPGLPQGWTGAGIVPGIDEIAVERPRDGGPARLLIVKHADSPPGKPLIVYQTIDATPWRGRTLVFSAYRRVDLEPEAMRRTADTQAVELHVDCDGGPHGAMAVMNGSRWTRRWIESNIPLKVPVDATRCSLGIVSKVKGEIRLAQVRLKDQARERENMLARHRPERNLFTGVDSMLPVGLALQAQATPPNLEFAQ
jgi:hypothetical protein